jgi:hypothetical protein
VQGGEDAGIPMPKATMKAATASVTVASAPLSRSMTGCRSTREMPKSPASTPLTYRRYCSQIGQVQAEVDPVLGNDLGRGGRWIQQAGDGIPGATRRAAKVTREARKMTSSA